MASISCGHCNGTHTSIDDVMVCASNHGFRWARKSQQPTSTSAPVRELRPVRRTDEQREENRSRLIRDVRRVGSGVPEGRYALRNQSTADNDISFYRVTKSPSGGTFVAIFASDEERRLGMERTLQVLVRIAADIEAATTLYGLTSKRCGVCGHKLTTQESRERGIGPVCAKNMGFRAA